jgi:minor extracellular serine protease Vpr
MRLTKYTLVLSVFTACLALAPVVTAATSSASRWVVVLNEPPAVRKYPGRIERTRAASEPYRQHLRQVQTNMRSQIESTHARVTGAVQHLLNGVFVVATPEQAAALQKLPGVKAVMHMRRYRKSDQLSLSNVSGAWNAVAIGGESNAGAGIRIGIIDTGIDQTHPAFQDSSLVAPAGYPICDVQADCAFTSNKVIVARSYVSDIIYSDVPSTSTNVAGQSRPDDVTARDVDGHGTGVAAVAAGETVSYNGTQITGVAPKAFLGNYKVFGSDDVNPNGSGNIEQALEDAVTDGMDVVNLSLGSPAYGGPLDQTCGPYNVPSSPIPISPNACDPLAYEIESAMQNALVTVVVAAGNEGANGYQFNLACGTPPCDNFSAAAFGTVGSPAYAPSAIAVGGIQNDVTYVQRVEVSGSGVPSNLQNIDAFESFDGPVPLVPLTAPLVDATQAGDSDGLLCSPLTPTALTGEIVLVLEGTCGDIDKVTNAQKAGAVGVIEIASAQTFFLPSGLSATTIPAFIIGGADGASLKNYVDAHTGVQGTLDPKPYQVPAQSLGLAPYSIAYFSSRGPVSTTGGLKPDLVAAATDFLLPAENYDPYGGLFNFSRYGTTQGTSFSTPVVTGSAALVKQANPGFTPLQIRSALVNTASLTGLVSSDASAIASISESGAGLLQTQNAVVSTIQVVPATLSFGFAATSLPPAQTLTFYNSGASSVTLTMTVVPSAGHSTTSAQVLVNNSSAPTLTVPANVSATATAALTGTPPAGRYEGVIAVSGGPVSLNIPYMFVAGDGVPFDIIPLNGVEPAQGSVAFDGAVGAQIPWYPACDNTSNNCVNDYGPVAIQVLDQYGVPVSGVSVSWAATQGGGSIVQGSSFTDTVTNVDGIAGATVTLGPAEGSQEFTATVNSMVMPFDGYARVVSAIEPNGIVDGASFTGGRAVAPGSWISVFGTNMTDTTAGNNGVDLAFSKCHLCNVTTQALPIRYGESQFAWPYQLRQPDTTQYSGAVGIDWPELCNREIDRQLHLQQPVYSAAGRVFAGLLRA